MLNINPKIAPDEIREKKEKDVLFIDVDGLIVHKQNSTRKSCEIKIDVVHESWEKKHPSSKDYELKNKSYWETLDNGQVFWGEFSRYISGNSEITNDTHGVIKGAGASWIQSDVDYFPNTLYTYDRYHIKSWIKHALSK